MKEGDIPTKNRKPCPSKKIDIPNAYKLNFTVKQNKITRGWTNLFRFTTTGTDNGSDGDRVIVAHF